MYSVIYPTLMTTAVNKERRYQI